MQVLTAITEQVRQVLEINEVDTKEQAIKVLMLSRHFKAAKEIEAMEQDEFNEFLTNYVY